MLNSLFSILLIATIVSTSLFAESPELPDAPSATQAKIKADLTKFAGQQKKVKLTLKDAAKLTGQVLQAGEENFQFRDARSGEVRQIAYNDVTETKKAGKSTKTKVLIALGVFVGLSLAVAAIACKTGSASEC